MAKITLTDLANLQNEQTAVAAINANNALIETAMENTLSRDGTSPNSMSAQLDMNSNRILNLPTASFDTDPILYGDLADYIAEIDPSLIVLATQSQAEAGSNNSAYMSPLRTKQAIQGGAFFTQTGTGADDRTLVARLKDCYHVKDFGATGDGTTNDYTAITEAIAAAKTAGKALLFTDGTYITDQTLDFTSASTGHFHVLCMGDVTIQAQTGAVITNVVKMDSGAVAGTYYTNCTFGGPHPIRIRGNGANTTTCLYVRGIQRSNFYVDCWNCTGPAIDCVFVVTGNFFRPTVSLNNNPTGTKPSIGMRFGVRDVPAGEYSANNTIYHPEIAGLTTGVGIHLTGCFFSNFVGGNSQSNNYGLDIDSASYGNCFYGVDFEGSGTRSVLDGGYRTNYYGCQISNGITFEATSYSSKIIGGFANEVNRAAGSSNIDLDGVQMNGSPIGAGGGQTVRCVVVNGSGVITSQVTDQRKAVATTGSTVSLAGVTDITSNSATGFTVGPNGTTRPVLTVDCSAASQDTGLRIVGQNGTAGLDLTVTSDQANEAVNLYGKGTGLTKLGSAGGGGSAVTIVPFTANGILVNDTNGLLSSVDQVPAARFPILTGDCTTAGGSLATTVNKVSTTTSTTSASYLPLFITDTSSGTNRTVAVDTALTFNPNTDTLSATNIAGSLANSTGLPVATGISGLGTNVATALAVNVGTAGAPVVNGGVLGTPSSGTLTNCSGLPITGITNTAYAKASRTGSNQSLNGAGTPVTLIFNNEIQDPGGNYNNTTGKFTTPAAGDYLVTWAVYISGTSISTNNTYLTLWVGADEYRNLPLVLQDAAAAQLIGCGSLEVNAGSSEDIYLDCIISSATSPVLVNSTVNTLFTVSRVR